MTPPVLLPAALAPDLVESLYAEHGPARPWTYWLILLGVVGALAALPLVEVDVTVRAPGLVRPATERAELKTAVGGRITQVLARDNDRVAAGQPLVVCATADLDERLGRNRVLQGERADVLHDLHTLSTATDPGVAVASGEPVGVAVDATSATAGAEVAAGLPSVGRPDLRTSALGQEFAEFRAQVEANRLAEAKGRAELARAGALAAKGIATQRELEDARYAVERTLAEGRLLVEQARTGWQARQREEATALAALRSEERRLVEERGFAVVRAPVAGTVQGLLGLAAGGYLAPGQPLGTVSPDDRLLIETLVSPRDIGLVRVGQPVNVQVDAFPYTQWGLLRGEVVAISGDLSGGGNGAASGAEGGAPSFFKVTVAPQATTLHLPNGVAGGLRKGLTLTARFRVARRTLLQLLYEDVSNWLDPQAQRI